ncbi:hypothetical protein L1080_033535 [Rhodococcus sp. MSC1_016]|uniref:hypothetical protein n=1 Tax=Rhodococcus sp. MSC1_016 TaxID=2909266 RepID=UPI00203000E5|nr:hypothetical protein [Rhodococcus sp. MSC1_016]
MKGVVVVVVRIFGVSVLVAVAALVAAFLYGGPRALFLAAVLADLEVSLSFGNAVIKAALMLNKSKAWISYCRSLLKLAPRAANRTPLRRTRRPHRPLSRTGAARGPGPNLGRRTTAETQEPRSGSHT